MAEGSSLFLGVRKGAGPLCDDVDMSAGDRGPSQQAPSLLGKAQEGSGEVENAIFPWWVQVGERAGTSKAGWF